LASVIRRRSPTRIYSHAISRPRERWTDAFNVISFTRRFDHADCSYDDLVEHGERYDPMEEFVDALIASIMSTSNPTDLSLSIGSEAAAEPRSACRCRPRATTAPAMRATKAKVQSPPRAGRRRAATYLSRESNSETVGELRAIGGAEVVHRAGA
jgi:hypothetical protein